MMKCWILSLMFHSFIQQLFLKSDNCDGPSTFAHAGQVAVNKRLSHFWGSQPKLKYSSVWLQDVGSFLGHRIIHKDFFPSRWSGPTWTTTPNPHRAFVWGAWVGMGSSYSVEWLIEKRAGLAKSRPTVLRSPVESDGSSCRPRCLQPFCVPCLSLSFHSSESTLTGMLVVSCCSWWAYLLNIWVG